MLSALLLTSVAPLASRMGSVPPRGVYSLRSSPGLKVSVYNERHALVSWPSLFDGDARRISCRVRYFDDQGFVMDDPLATEARRAGVVLTYVDFDESTQRMTAEFDGRMQFTVEFDRNVSA